MRVLKFTPLSLIFPSSVIVLHAALPALAIMNMLSRMTEWVRNGVGGCSVGESGGAGWVGTVGAGGGGFPLIVEFWAKREKALQGERSLAVLQWLASRRPHCVPAECPQWARPHCLHFDLSTEDQCSPVSTTPLIYSFLLLLTPPPSLFFVFWKCLHNSQNRDVSELICQSTGIGLWSDNQWEACVGLCFFCFFLITVQPIIHLLIKTKILKQHYLLCFLRRVQVGLFINLLLSNIQVLVINREIDRFVLRSLRSVSP